MNWPGRGTLSFLLLLPCISSEVRQARAAAPGTSLQEIKQAWRDREKRMRSLVFEWKEAEFVSRGVLSFDRVDGEPLVSTPVTYPPHDTTYNYLCGLKIDGKKMRCDGRGPRLVQQLGEYLPRRELTVNDGQVSKSYVDKDRSGKERFHASGFIREPRLAQEMAALNIKYRAILLCYRPSLIYGVDYDLSGYTAGAVRGTIRGHECFVLSASDGVWPSPGIVDARKGVRRPARSRQGSGSPALSDA